MLNINSARCRALCVWWGCGRAWWWGCGRVWLLLLMMMIATLTVHTVETTDTAECEVQQTSLESHTKMRIVDEVKNEMADLYVRPLEGFRKAVLRLSVNSTATGTSNSAGNVTVLQEGANSNWHYVTLQHIIEEYKHSANITVDGQELEFVKRSDPTMWSSAYEFSSFILLVEGKAKWTYCQPDDYPGSTSPVSLSSTEEEETTVAYSSPSSASDITSTQMVSGVVGGAAVLFVLLLCLVLYCHKRRSSRGHSSVLSGSADSWDFAHGSSLSREIDRRSSAIAKLQRVTKTIGAQSTAEPEQENYPLI